MSNDPASWPKWAVEEVKIEAYNTQWPVIAESLVEELKVTYPFQELRFDHVGSTAVPELPAKPIIDIAASVKDFLYINAISIALAQKDWNLVPPELDNKPNRRFFVKVVSGRRFAHLHLVLEESQEIQRYVYFRDLLRRNSDLRKEYETVKKHFANIYKNDREAYTIAKTDFVKLALTNAAI